MRGSRLVPGLPRRGGIGFSLTVPPGLDEHEASAHFTDEVVDGGETFYVSESAVFSNSYQSTASYINEENSSAAFTDTFLSVIPTTLNQVLAFTDQQSLEVESNLGEVIASVSAITSVFTTLLTTVLETAAFTDQQAVGPLNTVAETGVITDTLPTALTLVNNVGEVGAFTDAQSLLNTALSTVLETAAFTDTYLTLATTYANALEYLFASSTTQGGGAAGAWTADLESFAMSRYTNYPFNSMALVDGVLVGVSDEGVFRLDANDDDGVAIDAEVVHDWSDRVPGRDGMVSAPQFKLPRSLYLTGTTDGQMAVDLGYVDDDGTETDASYDIPNRTQDGFITNRVPLGRGIRSRFLQPTIKNVSGSDFTVTEAKIEVDLSKRSM